jgi:hypothetical protein
MGRQTDLYDRVASVVGDFDSAIYAEERQRDVVNEASALAYNVMFWGGLVLTCAMAWIGGPELLPWLVAVVALMSAGDAVGSYHISRAGVDLMQATSLLDRRHLAMFCLGGVALLGAVVRGGVAVDTWLPIAVGAVLGPPVARLIRSDALRRGGSRDN